MAKQKQSATILAALCASGVVLLASCALSQNTAVPSAEPQHVSLTTTPSACDALKTLSLLHVEITRAELQSAGAPVPGARVETMPGIPGAAVSGLPEFCRVSGHIHPEPDSDIQFEIWMPSQNWTGRYYGVGNGGFAGSISYTDLAQGIRVGQAVASTDTGHSGAMLDSAWAKGHASRVRDYGWRGIHLTATASKAIVAAYYGRRPERSYFMSCSNGGRQALMEASRFPDDYDGILAGAPASRWTSLAMAMINTVQAQLPPGAAIHPDQAVLLQSEVLSQCDALDGQTDGLIADPRRCHVDVSKLACGVATSTQCFNPAQITALNRIYAGPRDGRGQQLAPTYPPSGAEGGSPIYFGWGGWIFSSPSRQHLVFPQGLMTDFAPSPIASVENFDWDKDPARLDGALSDDLNADPDMSRFFNRGGKLILFHGWGDAAIPPALTIQFYNDILRRSGARARESTRLFMIPGMMHCASGPGPTEFGQSEIPAPNVSPERSISAALRDWTEAGHAPQAVIGRVVPMPFSPNPAPSGAPRERLICAYPSEAKLRDGADPDSAGSYSCHD